MTDNTKMRDFVDEVKQLCKDFSDLRDRPYMGDVVDALDSLYEQWQAAQSEQAVAVEDTVLPIANAYESGIGHCNDNLCNPYKEGSAEAFAYDYGKEFGKARGISQSVPVVWEPEVIAKSIAPMLEEWVDIGNRNGGNWREGLPEILKLRLERFMPTTSNTAQELDALRKDAERYRWLRDGNDNKKSAACHIAVNCYGIEWDAAIDAAIAQGQTK